MDLNRALAPIRINKYIVINSFYSNTIVLIWHSIYSIFINLPVHTNTQIFVVNTSTASERMTTFHNIARLYRVLWITSSYGGGWGW